jgi:glycosyltransferase involved in cell wall biosynthesis
VLPTITFFLSVRFPTEKAYGVTTSYTVSALEKTGKYHAVIVTPIIDQSIKTNLKVERLNTPFNFDLTRNKFNFKHNSMNQLFLYLKKLIYYSKVALTLEKKNNTIWCRDISAALVFCSLGHRVLCELHRTPNKVDTFILKVLSIFPKINFLPITQKLSEKLNLDSNRTVLAPMCVNKDELIKRRKFVQKEKLVIGYVGSAYSSDNRLNLDPVIHAANFLQSNHKNITFRLIGISQKEFTKSIFPSNIQFLGRISRNIIMQEIDSFDIGLVVYPDTKYFEDSFPIKIMEYAARRVPIIASDTASHRYLLGDRAIFFDLKSKYSLAKSILNLTSDISLMQSISDENFKWAKNFTYENRVMRILQKLDEV